MKAIIALVGMMLVALAGTARAEVDCSKSTFTPSDLKACLAQWKEGVAFPAGFNAQKVVSEYSAKDLSGLIGDMIGLKNALTSQAKDQEKISTATALVDAAVARQTTAQQSFDGLHCNEEFAYCIDRTGERYTQQETPPASLMAGDHLSIIVISDNPGDIGMMVLSAENVRRSLLLFPSAEVRDARETKRKTQDASPADVARLEITVKADVTRVIVKLNDKIVLSVPVEGRQHLVEFGLMLPFAYQREVTPQGAVQYGMEPDLAFTITVFLNPRVTSDPLQKFGRRWFGLMAGADLTNEISDKRYYLGLDFSPVSGLALNAGLAILPWEYVPNPEQVPDVLTGDIEPDRRYRPSFFFGARMTPEVFDTVKAAYQSLQGQ